MFSLVRLLRRFSVRENTSYPCPPQSGWGRAPLQLLRGGSAAASQRGLRSLGADTTHNRPALLLPRLWNGRIRILSSTCLPMALLWKLSLEFILEVWKLKFKFTQFWKCAENMKVFFFFFFYFPFTKRFYYFRLMALLPSGEMLLWTSLRPVRKHTGKIYWWITQCALRFMPSHSLEDGRMQGGRWTWWVGGRDGRHVRNDF